MQLLISKFKEEFRFLLCVSSILSKYSWAVSLKGKKGLSIVNAFQKKTQTNMGRQRQ